MFRDILAQDQLVFNDFIQNECHGSELCFANIFAWKNYDKLQIFVNDNLLIIKGKNFFFPPLVKNVDYQKGLDFIQNYCEEKQFPFAIYGVTEKFLPLLKIKNTHLTPHPELDEYLYNAQDLVTYSGKKFHSKRNLFNQFNKLSYEFVTYQKTMRNDIARLIDEWASDNEQTYEKEGIFALLDNIEVINCFCDCIIIDGKVEAFTIGSSLHDIGIVLFEKANTAYPGIYAAIVHLVAKKHFQNVKYINRQEDMGIENLKKSKLSYNPSGFIRKWHLTYDFETQARNIYRYRFNDSLDYQEFFFSHKIKEAHYLESNKIIKAMLFSRSQKLIFHQQEIHSKILFALASHPFYEKQGYMKELLTKLFTEWFNTIPIITLHPAISNFYQHLGFIEFDFLPLVPANQSLDDNIKLQKIAQIYETIASKYDVYEKREITRWEEIQNELMLTGGKISYLKDKEKIIGYLINDGEEITEVITNENFLVKSNNLLRIINLDYILRACSFIPEVSIQVIDNLIPQNNILIIGKTKQIKTMTIAELSKIIFKNTRFLIPSHY